MWSFECWSEIPVLHSAPAPVWCAKQCLGVKVDKIGTMIRVNPVLELFITAEMRGLRY